MNSQQFDAAGLPEGLRSAFGLGQPRTAAGKSRQSSPPKAKPATKSKPATPKTGY